MNDKTEVFAKLQEVFDDVFIDPPKPTEELSAKDVPEWDSLTHIRLIVVIEKAFGVYFRVGEVETAQNVGQLADLILKRLRAP